MPGRAWLINGSLVFSPNSVREPKIPDERQAGAAFIPGVSRARDYQEARWWSQESEWLAFVPSDPVSYSGLLLESLAHIPRMIPHHKSHGFRLPGHLVKYWEIVENVLMNLTEHLGTENRLRYVRPFAAKAWKYDVYFASEDEAREMLSEARDWFALWVGLMFWMTRKIPEDPKYVEGLMPPRWIVQVVKYKGEQTIVDLVYTAPNIQRAWNINRVGLWMHSPQKQPAQSPAYWFVEQGIPVWYRWDSNTPVGSDRGLIAPLPEQLQAATTWITPSPSFPNTSTSGSWDNAPWENMSHDTGEDTSDVHNIPFNSTDLPVASTGSQPTNSMTARAIWDAFWEKRERSHAQKRQNETKEVRQARENRVRDQPIMSAPVYLWDWDFDDASKFGRKLVPKADREECVVGCIEKQRRYDPYFNEWHCCKEWGPDWGESDDENEEVRSQSHTESYCELFSGENPLVTANVPEVAEAGEYSVPARPVAVTSTEPGDRDGCKATVAGDPSPLVPLVDARRTPEGVAERARIEVLEILTNHFGFVAPIPLPSSVKEHVGVMEIRSFLAILGVSWIPEDCIFFKSTLGKLCVLFARRFGQSHVEEKPPADLWDLSGSTWRTLKKNRRLSCIRTVAIRDGKSMYMFDCLDSSVPWNLAVYSAHAALFVCRLNDEMGVEDIALELLLSGVPFRTLQKRVTLGPAPQEMPMSTVVPMRLFGHDFNQVDFDMYERHCHCVMSLKRGRAALLRGGFVRRWALQLVGIGEALQGPSGIYESERKMFVVRDNMGDEYIDDELTSDELDMLGGLYWTFTGIKNQLSKLSWFPLACTWEGCGEDLGRWSSHAEELFIRRRTSILNDSVTTNLRVPLSAPKWGDKLRGFADGRRGMKRLEKWSKEFLDEDLRSS